MEDKWEKLQEKYRNSVAQICVMGAVHNLYRPYQPPKDYKAKGSSFFIDAKRGILLTNAHVLESCLSAIARIPKIGQQDFRLRIIAICEDKDLAVCQIYQEDLKEIEKRVGDLSSLNLTFADSLKVRETQSVMAVGFPLGLEIKFTLGNISGFSSNSYNNDSSEVDSWEDTPTFLQLTSPINPGNSGGPLLDTSGLVVGVNSAGIGGASAIGFAVSARTVQGVLAKMLESIADEKEAPSLSDRSALIPAGGAGGFPKIIRTPKVAFDWCEANPALISTLTPADVKDITGIYVTKVYPNSCLKILKENDLVSGINVDITTPCGLPGSPEACVSNRLIGKIDNYGEISLLNEEKLASRRKMTLKEILDLVPLGNEIKLAIWRDKRLYELKTSFTRVADEDKQPLKRLDLHYEPIAYEIAGGMVVVPLTMNMIERDSDLSEYAKGEKRYKRYIVVVQILPDTSASRTKSMYPGLVIDKINGTPVNTLEELVRVVKSIPIDGVLIVKAKKGQVFAVKIDEMIREDIAAMKTVGVPITHPYILSQTVPTTGRPAIQSPSFTPVQPSPPPPSQPSPPQPSPPPSRPPSFPPSQPPSQPPSPPPSQPPSRPPFFPPGPDRPVQPPSFPPSQPPSEPPFPPSRPPSEPDRPSPPTPPSTPDNPPSQVPQPPPRTPPGGEEEKGPRGRESDVRSGGATLVPLSARPYLVVAPMSSRVGFARVQL